MKKNNRNIIKILLNNKKVNNYTKLLLYLNSLDYYEDYYIPNRKLENFIHIKRDKIRLLLHQLEKDNLIKIFYKGRKRYFVFLDTKVEENKESEKSDMFDYNWLDSEDE